MPIRVDSISTGSTLQLGELIGRRLAGGVLILLQGELGAGKTVFAKGLGRGLGVVEEITSPSFNLMLRYEGRLRFDHWDLYRLDAIGDDEEFLESVHDNQSVTAVEWGERVRMKPDVPTLVVTLELVEGHEDKRNITFDGDPGLIEKIVKPSLAEWEEE
jgi:tRNA threonylcarbamoyladenosine biosynthesis protein TsaE